MLGLEAQPAVAHDKGSSHGGSRIIRMVYQEHPTYTSWLRRSYDLWRDLEKTSAGGSTTRAKNQSLLVTTGCLNASTPTAMGAHGHSCYDGAVESAELHHLPHEKLSADEVAHRFPGFSLPANFKALFDPQGGYLHPERAIETFVASAKEFGAQVECDSPVKRWAGGTKSGNGGGLVTVETLGGKIYHAERLVLTAGSWMGQLVPELAPVLQVERQVVGWFGPVRKKEGTQDLSHDADADVYCLERCPVFLIDDDTGYYYGFPADSGGLVKVGKYHHLGEIVSRVEKIDRSVHAADEAALRTCLQRYLPTLGTAPMRKASVCMFTNTPDGHFILDAHPRHSGRVILGSACSGHGFKFAPVLGEILRDLAIHGSTQHDVDMHRLDPERPGFSKALELFSKER